MSTYTLIQSQTLASSAASVTFSSIPATYTDLVLKMSGRSSYSGAAVYDGFNLYFNGDSSSLYSDTTLNGTGSANSSYTDHNQPYFNLYFQATGNSNTANTFGSSEVYIPNYTSTTSKPVSAFGVGENNTTNAYMSAIANLYRNTTAISSINIGASNNGGTWLTGSSFYLYGISNS